MLSPHLFTQNFINFQEIYYLLNEKIISQVYAKREKLDQRILKGGSHS